MPNRWLDTAGGAFRMPPPASATDMTIDLRAAPRPRPPIRGYAPGVFDMFHIGHLNILRRARLNCDYLIAGVVNDEVALAMKGRRPAVPENERLEIVASIDVVNAVFLEQTVDKLVTWQSVGFDVIFKGDDWKGTPKGERLEQIFANVGVQVVYLPYTQHTSTTRMRTLLAEITDTLGAANPGVAVMEPGRGSGLTY